MSGRPRKKIAEIPGHTHEVKQAKIDGVELSTKQKERSQGKGQAYIRASADLLRRCRSAAVPRLAESDSGSRRRCPWCCACASGRMMAWGRASKPAPAVTGNGLQNSIIGGLLEFVEATTANPTEQQQTGRAVHPAAKLFPLMSESELRELADDIKTNGLAHAIVRDAAGMVLDGRNRLAACEIAGLEPRFEEYTGDDPVAYIVSANIRRGHLTSEKKRELIAQLLKLNPEKSNLQIAKTVGADDKTVASVRADPRSEIPNVSKRTDTKGRKQPARRKKTKREPQATPVVSLNQVPATAVPANDIMSPVPDSATNEKKVGARAGRV